ncbi:DUF2617 family protein [Streptomyces profundus]|uniref:DUF2617 family protein n=1 Tax=Streptomyces profundus TaxID=2867410 RepID=UPI001D1652C4|nr:DUF2617 family protein [Streptomyces sp. MA3_2.13]UED86573.1 DUF2617 family protein [Streptomyces sp. MA3_2.13]
MTSGIQLAAPYRDTSADQLRFALDQPRQPALAVNDAQLGDVHVQLRLLGASHQVLAGPVRETLACLPAQPGDGPPTEVRQRLDGWDYAFRSTVRHCSPTELTRRTTALRDRLDDQPTALYGLFPGSPDALTALTARRDGRVISWRTWHVYPQAGQIVETRTRLEVP